MFIGCLLRQTNEFEHYVLNYYCMILDFNLSPFYVKLLYMFPVTFNYSWNKDKKLPRSG